MAEVVGRSIAFIAISAAYEAPMTPAVASSRMAISATSNVTLLTTPTMRGTAIGRIVIEGDEAKNSKTRKASLA